MSVAMLSAACESLDGNILCCILVLSGQEAFMTVPVRGHIMSLDNARVPTTAEVPAVDFHTVRKVSRDSTESGHKISLSNALLRLLCQAIIPATVLVTLLTALPKITEVSVIPIMQENHTEELAILEHDRVSKERSKCLDMGANRYERCLRAIGR